MALQKYLDKSLYQPSISQRKIFISANTMNHVIIVCVVNDLKFFFLSIWINEHRTQELCFVSYIALG